MNKILLIFNILCFSAQSIAIKHIRMEKPGENARYTAFFCLVAGFPLCIWHLIAAGAVSMQTVCWGALFGLLYAAAMNGYAYAMKMGPMSYTAFIFSGNMLPPILFSALLWKETVTLPVLLGIILFFLSFYLVGVLGQEKKDGRKGSGKWLFFCVLSMLLSGCSSTVLKAHQMATRGEESVALIGIGLLFAGVISFGGSLAASRGSAKHYGRGLKRNGLPILCAGIATGAGNGLFSYLSTRMAGSYFFPLISGGGVLVVLAVSVLFFREKMNRFGLVGIALGILAIVTINL